MLFAGYVSLDFVELVVDVLLSSDGFVSLPFVSLLMLSFFAGIVLFDAEVLLSTLGFVSLAVVVLLLEG